MIAAAFIILISIVIGGGLYRIRGGGLEWIINPPGTQTARMVWCIPTGILIGIVSGSPLAGAGAMAMAFLGLMIPHGWCQSGTSLRIALGMGAVCAARAAITTSPSFLAGGDAALILAPTALSSFAGLGYLLGHLMPVTDEEMGFPGYTAWGEFFAGTLMWMGIMYGAVIAVMFQ